MFEKKWGGRWDSNPRQPEPQSGALPLNYAHHTGASQEIRTPGPRLRRAMLYPTELVTQKMERVKGIEPSQPAWKAGILPLNYTRWSGRRDSNSRRSPWQGDALPLSHSRMLIFHFKINWCR